MKSFKKIIAIVLAFTIVMSVGMLSVYAKSYSGIVDFVDDKIVITCYDIDSVSKVIVNGTELTANTDYTTEIDGEDLLVYFTDSYLEKTLTKNFINIKVYINTDTFFKPSSVIYGDETTSEYFIEKETKEDFDDEDVVALLKFFVDKGFMSTNDTESVYYLNGEEVFYVTNEYAYPADIDLFTHYIIYTPTLAESLQFYVQDDNYYYNDGTIFASFGNKFIINFSQYEKAETFQISADNPADGMIIDAFVGLLEKEQVTCDMESFLKNDEADVYNASGDKKLMNIKMVDWDLLTVDITIAEDVTIEDNIKYLYTDVDMDLLISLIFENPKIKSGDNSTWTTGVKDDLVISSTAEYDDFINAYVDDKIIQKDKDYTVTEGSTVITLKEAFLSTLTVGEHTLDIVSDTGTATAKFAIMTAPIVDEPEEEKPIVVSGETEEIAQTGDTTMISSFVVLAVMSAAGFVSIKKRKIAE